MSSFLAIIEGAENKSLWCRSVSSLATISDQIQFVINESKITLSAINIAHVSHGEISFSRGFFKTFQFNSDDIVDDGLGKDEDGETIYSISIRSKILSVLFRKMEDDIESYKLSLNAGDDVTSNDRYRLHIEVKTKSMIRKQYNPYYQPYKYDKLGVAKTYKEIFLDQSEKTHRLQNGEDEQDEEEDNEEDEINYLMIGNSILKGFLENVGSTTEDFKLMVNSKNFSITAFTKGVYIKEKEILKQPMAINIVFSTDELLDLKLYNNQTVDKQIIFRLKDFKTFLNLGSGSDFAEVWFRKPGDPVLFELNKNDCCIQFVQVTDGDNNHQLEAKHTRVIPAERIIQRKSDKQKKHTGKNKRYDHVEELENEFINEPALFVPEDEDGTENTIQPKKKASKKVQLPTLPTTLFETADENVEEENGADMRDVRDEHEAGIEIAEEEETGTAGISWADGSVKKDDKISQLILNSKRDERRLINEAKSKYLDQIKRRKLDSNEENQDTEDDGIGPTQQVFKVKGIFD